jgi:uncharacterized membrane protein
LARRFEHSGEDISRALSLSDGLFAIVLTLLVLDVRLPDAAGGDLLPALADLWPRLLSYLITFLVAGQYWMAHHWDFEHIVRYDRHLLWLNLMFLLSVSVLPFSTALLGTFAASWNVYAVNMLLAGLTLTGVWGYATSHQLADPMVTPVLRDYVVLRHLVTPGVFLLSMPVALLAPGLAMYVTVLIPVLLAIVDRRLGTPRGAPESGRDRLWRLVGYLPVLAFVAWSAWLLGVYRR